MADSLPNSDRHQPDIWIFPLSSSNDGGGSSIDGGDAMPGANYAEDDDNDDDRVPFMHRGTSGGTGRGAALSISAQADPALVGASTAGLGEESSSPHSLASDENSILSNTTTCNNKRTAMQQQPISPPSSQRLHTSGIASNSGLLTDFCYRAVGQSRRLRTRHVAAGCLALIVIGMLQQQQSRHHNHDAILFHRSHQNVKTQKSSSVESSGTPPPFDVDGPPVPLTGHDTIQTLLEKEKNDAELHHKDRQSNRIGTSNPAKPNYPVIKEDDALVPGSSSRLYASSATATGDGILPAVPATLHAAEALLCRKSVVNFVINATDVKDECEGLKKAFDKTCSNSNADLDDTDNNRHQRRQERQQPRRTLAEKTRRKDRAQLFLYRHWVWIQRVYRAVGGYAESLWKFSEATSHSCQSGRVFFFSEDAVADAYRDGYTSKLVERDWDGLAFHRLLRQWSLQRQNEQELLYSSYDDEAENNMGVRWLASGARRANAVTEGEVVQSPLNETLKSPKQQQQTFPISLDLPTSNEHVSDKMVSETLLLTQGDKVIEKAHNESVMKKMKQQEAAQDAHTSSKAVADTNAAVAALLNDPTSVEARTCCASILSVYHENCSTDDNEQFSDSKLLLMLFVMAVCGIVKSLIRHYKVLWLPEAAGCILVGVLSGYILMYFPHHDISFDGNWFLRIMVPPIVFEAALSIDKRSFNRHIVPIVIFSVIGTLTATVVTAYVVHKGTTALSRYCTPIPAVEALTFGALISSIDPIAVLSVLSNMGMTDTDTIYVLIFGESLLNDGVSIVLFQTLVHFLDDNLVIDGAAISAAAVHFLVVAIGSLLIGVASGMMSTVYYWLFHGCQTPLVEVLMFMCWAMLPYYVCDGIEWSGIVAAVANGFVMDLYIRGQAGAEDQPLSDDSEEYTIRSSTDGPPSIRDRSRRRIFSQQGHLSAEARQHIGFVTEILATALETAIFAYLGIFLFSHRYHWSFLHTAIAIFACCISRAIMIPSLSLVANWITRFQQSRAAACRYYGLGGGKKSTPTAAYAQPSNGPPGVLIDKRMQVVLWFAGLRGAMSFALVEHVPLYDSVSGEGSPFKPELKAMTSASILFTVFVLGGYTYYIMEYLGLAPSSGGGGGSLARRGSHPNGYHNTYELASLISKADSGDEGSASAASAATRKTDANQGAGGGVVTLSGRQLAFRRQRQAAAATVPDAMSPNHNDD